MIDISDIPVLELLPHDPPMVLLNRALSWDEASLQAEVVICSDSIFCAKGGVPGWVGIEYMAQAVAAHAGYSARLLGEPPAIGYLLGTRTYKCALDHFAIGSELTIQIKSLFVEAGLGAFACNINMDGTVATATINVYQPRADGVDNFDSGKISR